MAACHKVGDVGKGLGPDLAALADKPADYLLVNILDPNRRSRPATWPTPRTRPTAARCASVSCCPRTPCACFDRKQVPAGALLLGMALATPPDVDAIGYWMGIPARSLLGHRGLTHSLAFALTGLLAAWACSRRGGNRGSLSAYFILVMISHGLLDAFTNGGPGVAFFSPSEPPVFLPVPSHRGLTHRNRRVQCARGVRIRLSEVRWVLLPAAALAAMGILLRRARSPRPARTV